MVTPLDKSDTLEYLFRLIVTTGEGKFPTNELSLTVTPSTVDCSTATVTVAPDMLNSDYLWKTVALNST